MTRPSAYFDKHGSKAIDQAEKYSQVVLVPAEAVSLKSSFILH